MPLVESQGMVHRGHSLIPSFPAYRTSKVTYPKRVARAKRTPLLGGCFHKERLQKQERGTTGGLEVWGKEPSKHKGEVANTAHSAVTVCPGFTQSRSQ